VSGGSGATTETPHRRARRLSAWPPLAPSSWALVVRDELPFPLNDPRCRLYARARHALWHGLRALPLHPGDAVLAPAYHHGSEIEVLVRLGLECRFYGLTEDLEPDQAELEALLTPSVRALQLTHYLGYPQDGLHWRRWCDEHGLLLIEDAAMAWLAETRAGPVGTHGDLAIFCLYKSFGLPDGGALISHSPPEPPAPGGRAAAREVAGLHLAWLLQRLPLAGVGPSAGRTADSDPYDPEEDFALGNPSATPAVATRRLLPRIADLTTAAARRANARILLEGLGDQVPRPFDRLPEGAAPFALPIHTPDKQALMERLARHGISALDFWSVPHPILPSDRFPDLATRRATTIGLPVHQELGLADLERILSAVRGQRQRTAELRLEPMPGFTEAETVWRELAPRSRNLFATWEWASTWWRHFGHGGTLRLVACRSPSGEIAALLPLYTARDSKLRTVTFVGRGPGDQLGPVCAPEDVLLAARAVRLVLRDSEPWDLFVGEHLPADQAWGTLLGARTATREASPVVDIETSDWDDFLAQQASGLRKQIRYQERRLEREHGLRYRLANDLDRLDDDFDLLCRLHERRWGDSSEAFSADRRPFLRDFVHLAFERGWLRLWFLELGGQAAAAWLGFRFAGVESYYQGGRDPNWDRFSVGAVLVAHTLREAIVDGVSEYRFLRGDEAYKNRLATRDPGVETVTLAGSPAGRAALAAAELRRAAGQVRRALARR
jgi:dTDP-4-amino-4,6-dideoxygalactose transaminase/CelD/BcsL family acetyltransferase involved in cellulose biosynthesis